MRFYLGTPKVRTGLVREDWHQTPETQHFRLALPENVALEFVKIWGVGIGRIFIGVQVYATREERAKQGFSFGPDPNLLDVIKDAQ